MSLWAGQALAAGPLGARGRDRASARRRLARLTAARCRTRAETFDIVIVGAGTAGCLLANRLSADPACRVLLLEAGGRDNYAWIHIPVGYLYCIGNPRTDWLYFTEPDPGLNGRKLRYPRGKVLGGCSSINGMIYMRGQARDYDAWAAATGDDAWRWDAVLPLFKRHEDHWRGADALHGGGAEWRVEQQRLRWDILDAFAAAAREAGIPATDDFNRGDNEGVGYFEVNQRRGVRWNASKAFLRPAQGRPNLVVRTGAQVTRVLLEGGRAVGVELLEGGHRHAVRARREVVLSAGAVGTPQLLQLSGIGPGALLQRHGIPVQHALPGVGENLQDHLQIRAVFGVEGVPTLNTLANSLVGQGAHRGRVRAHAQRADEHGAVAAGLFHALVGGDALAEHRVPRAAAVAGRLRRAAARLRRLHRQCLQPQPDGAWHGADPQPAARRTHRPSWPTTSPRPKTARSRPTACA